MAASLTRCFRLAVNSVFFSPFLIFGPINDIPDKYFSLVLFLIKINQNSPSQNNLFGVSCEFRKINSKKAYSEPRQTSRMKFF